MAEKTMYARIYDAVRLIPLGKVATYGQIAAMAGNGNAARVVGNALHVNPSPGEIPCHRVVNARGRLAPGFAFVATAAFPLPLALASICSASARFSGFAGLALFPADRALA